MTDIDWIKVIVSGVLMGIFYAVGHYRGCRCGCLRRYP